MYEVLSLQDICHYTVSCLDKYYCVDGITDSSLLLILYVCTERVYATLHMLCTNTLCKVMTLLPLTAKVLITLKHIGHLILYKHML